MTGGHFGYKNEAAEAIVLEQLQLDIQDIKNPSSDRDDREFLSLEFYLLNEDERAVMLAAARKLSRMYKLASRMAREYDLAATGDTAILDLPEIFEEIEDEINHLTEIGGGHRHDIMNHYKNERK